MKHINILNDINISYAIRYIKQRLKQADKGKIQLKYGERQALNIALESLIEMKMRY